MPSATDVARLEEIGYDVWRAPVVEALGGWRLRFANGLTGRANSVWTALDDVALPLDEKIRRARRQGHAREIMRSLTAWARTHGCTQALLQVESTNAPARTLYAHFGFRPAYEYRYLVAP